MVRLRNRLAEQRVHILHLCYQARLGVGMRTFVQAGRVNEEDCSSLAGDAVSDFAKPASLIAASVCRPSFQR